MTPRSRALVADDDKEMCELLAEVLDDEGYEVTVAIGGTKLLDALERQQYAGAGETFDIVISDVRMPDLSGFEVLDFIRARDWSLPVILISAYADQDAHDEARRLGASGMLAKPVHLNALRSLVKQIAERNG